MNKVCTPRLRACNTACSKRRAPDDLEGDGRLPEVVARALGWLVDRLSRALALPPRGTLLLAALLAAADARAAAMV